MQMNLSMKRIQTRGRSGQTCGCQGEGVGGGMQREVQVSRCKWLLVEWINNKALLRSTQNSDQYPIEKSRWLINTWKDAQHHSLLEECKSKLQWGINSHWSEFSSVELSSVAQSCLTLCDPMNRSTPGLPVHHQLLEFTQTHVYRVSDVIQPSHPLSSPSPAPNLSQHQSLFQGVNSLHEVAKVLEFQL